MLEVETEPILWPDIVENKDEWGVMWLQQAESISQEEGDIPDKAEREKE